MSLTHHGLFLFYDVIHVMGVEKGLNYEFIKNKNKQKI